ncbi:alpha/beta fold hydrolase [Hydrogenophaga laconesensis]|uniref:Pimeloyl-ACP methyl ester carboxylesterase n=1 Tax=Hydrogenophaga laconesensis TaxID=1805971 RepID=A0ABU1V7T6_9BURK|nr:alpha/beta fold hydrolase [Hydrogenophaga laconesensis]MDR7093531.1 pimeloyl-ACP methyl ester carboxylesterase [Hydrogenophaga laconesensis]
MIQYPLTLHGTRTRVLEAGLTGPVVVLIHGLSTRADRWKGAMEHLAEQGFRAIAFDLPGHGLADKPPAFDYTSQGLATYTLAVMDALGIPEAHLVGTSLGGHVASLVAERAADRCTSLYLVAPLGLAPIAPEAGEGIRRSVRNVSIEGVRAKLQSVFIDPSLATEELIVEESRINSSPGAVTALSALGDYIVERLNGELVTDSLVRLAGDMPVGLLWGEHDRMVPLTVGEAAAEALGQGELPVMRGVGHAPYVEQPEEFVRRWIDFATQACGSPA